MTSRIKLSLVILVSLLVIFLLIASLILLIKKSTSVKVLPSETKLEKAPSSAFSNIFTFTIDGWESGHNDEDLQYIASHYNFLITDGYSYYNSKVSYLHGLSPNLKILAYRNGTVVVKSSSDWNYITANHPDWFLLDAEGNRIYEKGFPLNYLLNPQNQEWRNYRANQLQEYVNVYGYDGVYLDIISSYIKAGYYIYYSSHPINPKTGQPFANDEWRESNREFLAYMKQAVGNKLIIFNGLGTGTGVTYYEYNTGVLLNEVDGMVVEGFTRWRSDSLNYFRTEAEWKKDIDLLVELSQKNKITLTYTRTAQTPPDQKIHLYSLASYLLGTGGKTYYNFEKPYSGRYQPYDDLWTTKIGTSIGGYYQKGNVYQRDFTNGKVLVNPTYNTYTVSLGATYKTLEGAEVSQVIMSPHTGMILLNSPNSSPSPSPAPPPAPSPAPNPLPRPFLPWPNRSGEIIVKFKNGVTRSQVEAFNAVYGVQILKVIPSLNIYLLGVPQGLAVSTMIDIYNSLYEVEYALLNYQGWRITSSVSSLKLLNQMVSATLEESSVSPLVLASGGNLRNNEGKHRSQDRINSDQQNSAGALGDDEAVPVTFQEEIDRVQRCRLHCYSSSK